MTFEKNALESYKNIMGDEYIEFAKDLIDTFLESSPNTLDQLKDAMKNNDSKTFVRAAHSFKSNAKTFGANDLADIAFDLEKRGNLGDLTNVADKLVKLEIEYQKFLHELEVYKNELK
jgi:HPt (histidine-containing phosphotransfer) domain-containing protein